MIHADLEALFADPLPVAGKPAGITYLPDMRVLTLQGPDHATFLQGYLTIDTSEPDPGWHLSALCNLKGRVVASFWYRQPGNGCSELIVHRSLVTPLQNFLAKYLMFARSSFLDDGDRTAVLGAVNHTPQGGHAGDLVIPGDDRKPRRLLVVRDTAGLAVEPRLPASVWWAQSIRRGEVIVSASTSERFLPQSLGLDRVDAVDFSKGCYLGQEVVARAQHRGEVKQRLVHLRWRSEGHTPILTERLTGERGATADLVMLTATDPAAGIALAVTRSSDASQFEQGPTVFERVDGPGD